MLKRLGNGLAKNKTKALYMSCYLCLRVVGVDERCRQTVAHHLVRPSLHAEYLNSVEY